MWIGVCVFVCVRWLFSSVKSMQGRFLWQWLYTESPHDICSFSSWKISKLRIKLCYQKNGIDPYSPKRDRVQMSSSNRQHRKIHRLRNVCTHTAHPQGSRCLLPCWPLPAPACYGRGEVLDSRQVKLELWEHCHSDRNTLKFSAERKSFGLILLISFHPAAARWLEFRLMIAPGNSWKE